MTGSSVLRLALVSSLALLLAPGARAADGGDLSGLDFESLADLDGGPPAARVSPWRVGVPAHEYRFLRLSGGGRVA
jgi:hypothetical protein